MEKRKITWGEWLNRRARYVGFRRQQDVAQSIGCSRQQLVKWYSMDRPPTSMRKGFDSLLARALQVDRKTLFVDWSHREPESVLKLIMFPPPSSDMPAIWDADLTSDGDVRRSIMELCKMLQGSNLREVLTFAHKQVLAHANALGSDKNKPVTNSALT